MTNQQAIEEIEVQMCYGCMGGCEECAYKLAMEALQENEEME